MTATSSPTSLTTLRIAGLLGIGTLGLTACAAEVEAEPTAQQEDEATEQAEGTDADAAAGEAAAQHAEEEADVELGPLEQTEVEDLLIDPSDLSFSSPTEIRSTGGSIREELHMLGAVASGFSREAVEDNPDWQPDPEEVPCQDAYLDMVDFVDDQDRPDAGGFSGVASDPQPPAHESFQEQLMLVGVDSHEGFDSGEITVLWEEVLATCETDTHLPGAHFGEPEEFRFGEASGLQFVTHPDMYGGDNELVFATWDLGPTTVWLFSFGYEPKEYEEAFEEQLELIRTEL